MVPWGSVWEILVEMEDLGSPCSLMPSHFHLAAAVGKLMSFPPRMGVPSSFGLPAFIRCIGAVLDPWEVYLGRAPPCGSP